MILKKIYEFHWKFVQLLFFVFAFTLPFSIKFSNILLAIIAGLLLIRKDIWPRFVELRKHMHVFFFVGLLSVYALSILWSENSRVAGFTLEKHLTLLVIPVTLSLNYDRFTFYFVRVVLCSFWAGVFFSYTYLIGVYSWLVHQNANLELSYFFREIAVQYVELHPTYLAMYSVFSIAIILVLLKKSKSGIIKFWYIALAFILLGLTLLTGARMPLLALILVLIIYSVFIFKQSKYWIYYFGLILVLLCSIIILASKVDVVNDRVREFSETKMEPPLGLHFNSINLRVAQLICSKEIISENWLAGVGIGDSQDKLNECYAGHGWSPALYERNYNAHNQFLQTFIGTGIVGILLFLGILSYTLWYSVRYKSLTLLLLVVLFTFCCLTESMLEKNKGIVFYTFFSVLLMAKQPFEKEEEIA